VVVNVIMVYDVTKPRRLFHLLISRHLLPGKVDQANLAGQNEVNGQFTRDGQSLRSSDS
jgi:hypothetical protein